MSDRDKLIEAAAKEYREKVASIDGWVDVSAMTLAQQAFKAGWRAADANPKPSKLLGKYRETDPKLYAESCNDFGGSYSGDDLKKIRAESYSQGFYDCEMAHGPNQPDERVERLEKERDAYANAMKVALSEGLFINKDEVKKRIEDLLQEFEAKNG